MHAGHYNTTLQWTPVPHNTTLQWTPVPHNTTLQWTTQHCITTLHHNISSYNCTRTLHNNNTLQFALHIFTTLHWGSLIRLDAPILCYVRGKGRGGGLGGGRPRRRGGVGVIRMKAPYIPRCGIKGNLLGSYPWCPFLIYPLLCIIAWRNRMKKKIPQNPAGLGFDNYARPG